MSKKYTTLLFDLDDTLVDDTENRKYAITQILLDRNETITDERLNAFIQLDNKYWQDRAAGKMKDPFEFKDNEVKTEWVRAQRFIRYFKNISYEEAVNINNKYIDCLNEHIVPIKHSTEVLEYLYKRNYDIYIVTNSPKIVVDNKLRGINSLQYIKDTLSSDEMGIMKPRKGFFDEFFKRTGIQNKDELIIIGDELDKDVLGGVQNGFDSCWVNLKKQVNTTNLEPTYEINDLLELKNIL